MAANTLRALFGSFDKADFEHASFEPVDFNQIYAQVIIGEEELPFLQRR